MKFKFVITGSNLSLELVEKIAHNPSIITIASQALSRIKSGRAVVEKIVKQNRTVYGITTGFGRFAEVRISLNEIDQLQENLIKSHATGVGQVFQPHQVRAIMLLQTNQLAKGASGVRPIVVQQLLGLINNDIIPLVPRQGSVGASGDLSPLAHIGLVMIGRGQAFYKGKIVSGAAALKKAGMKPLILKAKEGLAITNGTEVMTAIGILNLLEAERLCKMSDIAGAMSLEALRGTNVAFDAEIQKLRPHRGQGGSADNLRRLMTGSQIRRSHKECLKVQDAYSLRCMPQVHGATKGALQHIRQVLETELNSVTDNPLVIVNKGQVLSGGNFHGQPVALAMDYLGIATAELADISERRISRLLDVSLSGLPGFLTQHGGLNSGLMIVQNTAASLVSENKVLAHPSSVDSIPTSANQEDHVSMGTIGARKAGQICDNVRYVLACELLCASQGLEFHKPLKPGKGVNAAYQAIRARVKSFKYDREFYRDIEEINDLIGANTILHAVESNIGKLK
ncbi:MAG: histidine ammonia-lyase [Candidatus Edwardsbacteria bacterium]|nr:histidine ammonia-lyase [Candidatus Edwardsbacteria bacterium]MBU1576674.1 histidine ammonia-lyase [Candidatus Edwardsbacteria bacterium]MBU2594502.1 histidine ammonia-lyase [Candidatus Edwardsbacteria bacterium]